MSARYWTGPDDRRYAYNVEPTFVCPIGKAVAITPDSDPPAMIVAAADALGMDPHRLGVLLRKSSCGARDRVNDKLTDRCACHGVKMDRRGFRAFIDEPIPEAEWDGGHRTNVALNRRLYDPDYVPRRVIEQRYVDTKREAREWAWARREAARKASTERTPAA